MRVAYRATQVPLLFFVTDCSSRVSIKISHLQACHCVRFLAISVLLSVSLQFVLGTMSMSLRICILETDILRPELVEQYHGYGKMFEQLFARQPLLAQFFTYNVVKGEYPTEADRFDAYLVTGSKADSFGGEPWILSLKKFLMRCYNRGDKLLGICFGHQLLALMLGGRTERAIQGWGVGVHDYKVDIQTEWMTPYSNNLALLVSHQDQVTLLPKGAATVASSAFCPNAAYHIGDQVLCFQGHPEFSHDYSRALLDLRMDALGEEVHSAAVQSLKRDQQGSLVGEWMMRFVACK